MNWTYNYIQIRKISFSIFLIKQIQLGSVISSAGLFQAFKSTNLHKTYSTLFSKHLRMYEGHFLSDSSLLNMLRKLHC